MSAEFSVCQFFPDESYEYVRRFVSEQEAVDAFKHYTTCVGAQIGLRGASSSRMAAIAFVPNGSTARALRGQKARGRGNHRV